MDPNQDQPPCNELEDGEIEDEIEMDNDDGVKSSVKPNTEIATDKADLENNEVWRQGSSSPEKIVMVVENDLYVKPATPNVQEISVPPAQATVVDLTNDGKNAEQISSIQNQTEEISGTAAAPSATTCPKNCIHATENKALNERILAIEDFLNVEYGETFTEFLQNRTEFKRMKFPHPEMMDLLVKVKARKEAATPITAEVPAANLKNNSNPKPHVVTTESNTADNDKGCGKIAELPPVIKSEMGRLSTQMQLKAQPNTSFRKSPEKIKSPCQNIEKSLPTSRRAVAGRRRRGTRKKKIPTSRQMGQPQNKYPRKINKTCRICKAVVNGSELRHILSEHSNNLPCWICGKQYRNWESLQIHMINEHQSSKRKCNTYLWGLANKILEKHGFISASTFRSKIIYAPQPARQANSPQRQASPIPHCSSKPPGSSHEASSFLPPSSSSSYRSSEVY